MNHKKIRALLIKHKRSVDENGFTALQIAAMYNDLEAVRILASEEAGMVSANGETALTLAINNKHYGVVSYLAEFEGRVLLPNGYSALTVAIDVGDIEIVKQVIPYSINTPMSLPEVEHLGNMPSTVFQYIIFRDLHAAIPLAAENFQIMAHDFQQAVLIAKSRTTKGAELCLNYLDQYRDALMKAKCSTCSTLSCKVARLEQELKEAEALPYALKNEIVKLKSIILRKNYLAGKCIACKAIILRENTNSACNLCHFDPNRVEHVSNGISNLNMYTRLKDALGFVLAENLSLKTKLSMNDSITGITGLDPMKALEEIAKKLSVDSTKKYSEETVSCMLAATRSLVQQAMDARESQEEPYSFMASSNTSKISSVSVSPKTRSPHSKNPPSPGIIPDMAEETDRTLRSLQRALEDIRSGWPTMLMRAAADNNLDQAKQLIFQANLYDKEGRTALMYAAENGNKQIVELLLDKEAQRSDEQGRTALMYAVAANSYECVKLLVPKEACMATNSRHRNKGTTALMVAARSNNVELAKLLLDKEAKQTRDDGVTALMQAAQANACACLRLLVSKEAGRYTNDDFLYGQGYTALMFAASNGHLDAVKILMHHEASARLPDGRQAIDLTTEKAVINELAKHTTK